MKEDVEQRMRELELVYATKDGNWDKIQVRLEWFKCSMMC